MVEKAAKKILTPDQMPGRHRNQPSCLERFRAQSLGKDTLRHAELPIYRLFSVLQDPSFDDLSPILRWAFS